MLVAVRFSMNKFGYSVSGLIIEIAIGVIVYIPMLLLYYYTYLKNIFDVAIKALNQSHAKINGGLL